MSSWTHVADAIIELFLELLGVMLLCSQPVDALARLWLIIISSAFCSSSPFCSVHVSQLAADACPNVLCSFSSQVAGSCDGRKYLNAYNIMACYLNSAGQCWSSVLLTPEWSSSKTPFCSDTVYRYLNMCLFVCTCVLIHLACSKHSNEFEVCGTLTLAFKCLLLQVPTYTCICLPYDISAS